MGGGTAVAEAIIDACQGLGSGVDALGQLEKIVGNRKSSYGCPAGADREDV